MENKTLEKIKGIISARLASEVLHNKIFNATRAALAAYEGKTITKRFATAVQKALDASPDAEIGGGAYTVQYNNEYSQYKLEFIVNDRPAFKAEDGRDVPRGWTYERYKNRLTLYLGGAWDAVFTLEGRPTDGFKVRAGFDNASGFAGYAAVKRIAQRRALLADEGKLKALAAAIDMYNAAYAALLGGSSEDGDAAGLLKQWDEEAGTQRITDCYAIEELMDGRSR